MFISEKSIQQIRSLSIIEVISHYVKMDRNGKACCPFHNEKTPSFKVTESKGMYKCFGCGVAGDHINFVQQHDKLSFHEAIERIASLCQISLEYEEVPDKEKYEQQKNNREKIKEVLTYTINRYRDNLLNLPGEHPVIKYLLSRNITKETIIEWQLGWATEDWQHISPDIINKNWYEPAHQLGIVKRSKDDRNYDGYRSRITIPITNRFGEYIGLAGRFFLIDEADKDKNYPKYINPPQNELYDKSKVLFGLSQADKAIEKEGFVWLVEGYTDVTTLHSNNEENTVGTCGTALTAEMATLIKRYTSHVVILRDGDTAGRAAAIKDIFILAKSGLKTEIAFLPDGEDPDSYKAKTDGILYNDKTLNIQDGILWYADSLLKDVFDDTYKLGQAQQHIIEFISIIPNDIFRANYLDAITRKYKWKKSKLEQKLNEILDKTREQEEDDDDGRSNLDKMPKWMDRDEYQENGYCAVNNKKRTGFYGFGQNGWIEISNFLINPLFHIPGNGLDSRHLVQMDNGRRKVVVDMESSALINIDTLHKYSVGLGIGLFYGSKPQILRIATNLLQKFPRCIEIKYPGWQQAGFFAFADKIYIPPSGEQKNGELRELDEWGVVKFNNDNYLIPASSAAMKELATSDDDSFELHRALSYIPGSITFSDWAKLMHRVFREKGPVAIAYVVLSLFRDIIFSIDNNCPHLYGYGEKSSGKSKWADSITAVFFKKRSAFNLNSGTDFAFFSYMQMFQNCPAQLNEFDEKTLKPEWFQNIKGVFDGEGRQRGVMGSKNKVEIMKVRSAIILTGQFLLTADDNSIVSRSIIEGFNVRDLTDDDKKEFDKLYDIQQNGLSHILIELLQYRHRIKEQYREEFNKTLSKWRKETEGETNIRIMQNWCHLYTCWQLVSDKVSLPLTNQQFEKYCLTKALHWSGFIRSSDTLSEFWNTIAFLVDQGLIIEGWDFRIKEETSVKLRRKKDGSQAEEEYTLEFPEPTKLIYLRMNNVHKHYQQAYKNRTGKEGMSLENLNHYFSGRKYFLGNNKQSKFKKFITETVNVPKVTGFNTTAMMPDTRKIEIEKNTSSSVFLYTQLGLDLERTEINPEELAKDEAQKDLPF